MLRYPTGSGVDSHPHRDRRLDAVVRDQVRSTLCEELAALKRQANQAAAALESMRRAANLRVTLWTAGLTAIAAAIALSVAWWVLPSRAEIAKLGAEPDDGSPLCLSCCVAAQNRGY